MRKVIVTALIVGIVVAGGVALANHEGGGGSGWIFQFDSNHDDAISRDEFSAAHAAVFARMDRNGDQQLTRDELAQGPGEGH